jgi:predicted molibdopterin-dependent oxidoreductase YjgC
VDPPGQARADWEIICDLARAAGYDMPHYGHPREVYAEMAGLSPKFGGISHQRIDDEGDLHWPCTSADDPGTPTLHEDGPLIGKAPFQAVSYRPSAELPDPKYPLVLSTGRTLYHYNVATQTRRDEGTVARQPECFLQMHRYDAKRLGFNHGDRALVASRRGSLECVVHITKEVRPGCVWMPFHFSEARVNKLTNDAGDEVTGTAEYKVCAVRVQPLA